MHAGAFYLFVSHVSDDRAAALEIVAELEKRGIPCWVAPRNVTPGGRYDDEIADAIEGCRAMLLIFSDRCNRSEYIHREITVAGENQKLIIPFRIEDVRPKRGLSVRLLDLHWIDGFVERERALDELAATVTAPSVAGDGLNPAPAAAPRDGGPANPIPHRRKDDLPHRRKDDVPHRRKDDAKRDADSAIQPSARGASRSRSMSRDLRIGVAVILLVALAIGGGWAGGLFTIGGPVPSAASPATTGR